MLDYLRRKAVELLALFFEVQIPILYLNSIMSLSFPLSLQRKTFFRNLESLGRFLHNLRIHHSNVVFINIDCDSTRATKRLGRARNLASTTFYTSQFLRVSSHMLIINILRLFQHLYYSIKLPLKTLYFFQRKEISFFASIHPHHHKIQQFLDAVLSTFVDILLGGKSPLAADRWQPI